MRQVSVTIWIFVYRGLLGQMKGFDLYVCKVSFAEVFVPWQETLTKSLYLSTPELALNLNFVINISLLACYAI